MAVTLPPVRAVGLAMAIPGLAVASGVLVFLAFVHRGPRREVLMLARLAVWSAALAVVGALVEIAGVADVLDESFADALRSGDASAGLLRLLGAGLIVLGLFEPPVLTEVGVGTGVDGASLRWSLGGSGVLAAAGTLVGVLSYSFDGHTTTRGPRAVHAALDAVHVAAGSVWAGGAVALLALAVLGAGVAAPAGRFGRVAFTGLVATGLTGALMSAFVADSASDYWLTPWGRWLLVKLGFVAVAGAAIRGRRLVLAAVQATALVAVLVAVGLLVRAAPV